MGQGNPHRIRRSDLAWRKQRTHGQRAPYVPTAHFEVSQCPASDKLTFRTPARAARLLERLRRIDGAVGLMVYKCKECARFHIGHDIPGRELGERRQAQAHKQRRAERPDTSEGET